MVFAGCATTNPPAAKPIAVFNVRDYGAKGDRVTKDTAAFQRALDACAATGGGKVIVPAGNYLLGSVTVGSNTALELEKDAYITESPDLDDYPMVRARFEGEITDCHRALIDIEKASHVAIEGPGGFYATSSLCVPTNRNPRRPSVIETINCDDVTLANFSLQYDQPAPGQRAQIWCVHLNFCNNCTIRNLYIRSELTNGDGLDIDSCANVIVDRCDIRTGDDAISIKSGRGMEAVRIGRPTENVLIENSKLASVNYAAIGFGTEISGGVRHIRVEHCTLGGKQNTIFIKSRDGRGGYMQDIHGENLVVEGWPTPFIGIDLMSKGTAAAEQVPGDVAQWTLVSDISFKNVQLNDAGYIVQVQAANTRGGGVAPNATTGEPNVGIAPERPLDGLTLENITGTARHGFVLTNMKNLNFSGIKVTGYAGPLYTLSNATGTGLDEPNAAAK